MPFKRTRYRNAREFELASDGSKVFGGVRPRGISPAYGVIEHVIQIGDRLDLLARHYYNDDRLWWRIVDANPSIVFPGDMVAGDAVVRAKKEGKEGKSGMEGEVILIPQARE